MKQIPTRRLIVDAMTRHHSSFEAQPDATPGYWFREPARGDWLWDGDATERAFNRIVVFGHSSKESCFSVDVYCGLQPTWNKQFGGHLLASSTGLPNVRLGSRSIPASESTYPYDGTEDGAVTTLDRIGEELRTYAIRWFDGKETSARSDVLTQCARSWLLRRWVEIPLDVGDRLAAALKAAEYRAWDVDFALLQELKDELRMAGSNADLPFEQRQEISSLAVHALEYAQYRKRTPK